MYDSKINDMPRFYRRKGTPDDPFIPITASYPIINGRIVLGEIPDRFTGVQIVGYNEIQSNMYNATVTILDNEYLVDYDDGIVYFSMSQNGKNVSVFFNGIGYIAHPASRIYTHVEGTPDVVENLQNIIDRSLKNLGDAEQIVEEAEETIGRLNDVANTSLRIPKPYVANFDSLLITYPNPQIGWTVLTVDTGITYRWDGSNWIGIETLDTYPYQSSRIKLIPFVTSAMVKTGAASEVISMPFNGEVIGVDAFLVTAGTSATVIRVEKCSREDFDSGVGWTSILSTNIRIEANERTMDATTQPPVIGVAEVNVHDLFRVVIVSTSGDAKGLTVQVKVRV